MKPAFRRSLILWSLLAAAAAIAAGLWCYNRFFYEHANPSLERYPVRGIDISAHNGEIDFKQVKEAGIAFAYVKATEGTNFIDRRYMANVRGLRRVGIPAGAYHFFRFDTDPTLQALNFLAALQGRRFELPPAVDVEEWGNPDGHETARIVERLKVFMSLLETRGYSPLIYTNRTGFSRFLATRPGLDRYPLWICSFTDPPLPSDPDRPWVIWQYSHRGSVPGIPSDVDLDLLNCPDSIAPVDFFRIAAASPH